MTAIGLLPLCAIVLSLFVDSRYILYAFVPACLLMASAAIFLGGQGITPAHLMLGGLALCCAKQKAGFRFARDVMIRTMPGMALLALAIYGSLLAFFYPRFFPGSTNVNMFAVESPYAFFSPPPLEPSSANITQSIYTVGSFFTFFAVLTLCDSTSRYRQFYWACLATVVLNLMFAFLDLATYYTGTGFLLDFIHNGNYVLRTGETAVLGLKRISGSFTETSAFSATTLGLFAFTLQLWLRETRTWLMLLLTAIQAGLLVLSTSSTGLGGLLVVLPACWLVSFWRLLRSRTKPLEAWFAVLFPLLVASLVLGTMVFRPLREVSSTVIQAVFLDKAQSDSGIERLMLNAQALTNFFDSSGIGLGFGSVRTSSFALALLASVGVPGTILFAMFLASLLFAKRPPGVTQPHAALQDACRMACFALLTAACISATSMDLNLLFFVFAAGGYWPQAARFRRPAGVPDPASGSQTGFARHRRRARPSGGFSVLAGSGQRA